MQVRLTKDNRRLIAEYIAWKQNTEPTYSSSATEVANYFIEVQLRNLNFMTADQRLRRTPCSPSPT